MSSIKCAEFYCHKISLLAAPPAPNTLNPISQCIYQTILSLFINPFFTLDWELPEEKKNNFYLIPYSEKVE